MIATAPSRAAILSPKAWPYLLLDRFTADKAAPLGSPLAVDVGSLTVTDAANKLSEAGGVLRLTGNNGVSNDTYVISASSVARVAGRAFLCSLVQRSGRLQIGWSSSADFVGRRAHLDTTGNTFQVRSASGASVGNTDSFTAGATYQLALVPTSNGTHVLVRGGTEYPTWKLLYPQAGKAAGDTATPLYVGAAVVTQPSDIDLDDFRVVDLGGAWVSDYGIATSRLAGARSAGDSLGHTPDCLLEFTVTTLPSVGSIQVAFRQQDTSNRWYLDINSAGAIVLNEYVAAGATSRGSSTGVANGNRVVVVADGTSIKVYVADVSKISYASASNFATATTAQVVSLGTGGAVSDLVAWPRTISLPQGA